MSLQGISVLLVEDDRASSQLLTILLTRAGAQVRTVGTAAAALEAFYQTRPNIIISDVGLPGKDGYSLIHEIRAREADQQLEPIPAIALTAYARREDRHKAREAGFQEHVAKPVELATLTIAIRKLLTARNFNSSESNP